MESKSYTSSFSIIYDDIMNKVPYYFWYKYLKHLLAYYNKSPENIMELACGTGNMIKYFINDVNLIYGLDKSNDMLSIANNKLSKYDNIKLFNTDMKEVNNYGKFDFIYSVFDSLNYILNYNDLVDVFKNAYNNLNSKGIFIFDMNTLYRLMNIIEGTKKVQGDKYTCYWEDVVDKENKKWIVNLNIYIEQNGSIENFTEKHIEKGYKIKDIKRALKKAGFKNIDIYKSFSFKNADRHNDRIHFVALKDKQKNISIKQLLVRIKWNILKPFLINF